jgi:hypothetical protein
MSDVIEKTGNAIDRLDLPHGPFIDHGDYVGSSPGRWGEGIASSHGMQRGMVHPPPELPWPGEDVEQDIGLERALHQ